MMVIAGHVSSAAEAVIEAPDLSALESAEDRRLIDRELAALQQVRRPGAVGAVMFDLPRPQIATGRRDV